MDNHKKQMREFKRKKNLEKKRKEKMRIYRNRTFFGAVVVIVLIVLILMIKSCASSPKQNSQGGENTITPSPAVSVSPVTTPVLVNQAKTSSLKELSKTELASFYKKTLFFGNSQVGDLEMSNLVPDAKYIYKVGLTVTRALTEETENGMEKLTDGLSSGTYDNIFFLFGENEMGWSNYDAFERDYKALINKAKAAQPKADINLISVLPISKSVSDIGTDGETIENVKKINARIRELAINTGCGYVDVYSVFAQTDGYLPDNMSSDGVHLDRSNNTKLVSAIANEIMSAKGENTQDSENSDGDNDVSGEGENENSSTASDKKGTDSTGKTASPKPSGSAVPSSDAKSAGTSSNQSQKRSYATANPSKVSSNN